MIELNTFAKETAEEVWKGDQQIDLVEILEISFQKRGANINDPLILGSFDEVKNRIIRIVERKIDDAVSRGITPRYRFSEIDRDRLIPQFTKPISEVARDLNLSISALSWRAFEHFCVHILKVNYVEECEILRGTKDEGIDLVGLLDLGQLTRSAIWYGMSLRVLGQVKIGRVPETQIRQFSQDMRTFLEGNGRAFELASNRFKQQDTVTIGVVLTRSNFTSGAIRWAASHNIATKDVHQMIESLLKNNKHTPGLQHTEEGLIFVEKEFTEHFESLASST